MAYLKTRFKIIVMKKIIILVFGLQACFAAFSQTDTMGIEQYCQVIATPRLLSNVVTIDVDFGAEKSFWRDTRLKTCEGRLKKFNTVIDALNYMGREGWVFINAYPVRIGETEIYHFAFKKKFCKSDFQ
jgi:hypothetical protein